MRKCGCISTRCSGRGSSQAAAHCQAGLCTPGLPHHCPWQHWGCSHSSCSLHRASAWLTPIPRGTNPSAGAGPWPGHAAAATLGALAPEASLEQGGWGLNPTNSPGAEPTETLNLQGCVQGSSWAVEPRACPGTELVGRCPPRLPPHTLSPVQPGHQHQPSQPLGKAVFF